MPLWMSAPPVVAMLMVSVAAWADDGASGPSTPTGTTRFTVGAVETVRVYPSGIEASARIDTGAKTSSINAADIVYFVRNGRRWVRFTVLLGRTRRSFERPVVRIARIRRAGGAVTRRPVVTLGLCLGRFFKWAQVNLQDRSRMTYPILIGRRFMAGAVLVDPGREDLSTPSCPAPRPE